jgi:3-isopropylmalate/(R)-2-methylmalate dehydratase small subunit
MEPFRKHCGIVVPLHRENIDTDQIIPKQHLKRIERAGFGAYLFSDWRFHPDGAPRQDFVLNQEHYCSASILVAGKNFGCGSSREHAAWALSQFGIRVIIAPSYADIFRINAGNNGLLLIEAEEATVQRIAEQAQTKRPYELTIDLESQTVADDYGFSHEFVIEPFRRHRLLHGLDEIGMTLTREAEITRFEHQRHTFLHNGGPQALSKSRSTRQLQLHK